MIFLGGDLPAQMPLPEEPALACVLSVDLTRLAPSDRLLAFEHFRRAMDSFRPQCSVAPLPGRSSIDVQLAGQTAPQGLPRLSEDEIRARNVRPAPPPTLIQPAPPANAPRAEVYVCQLSGSNVSGDGTYDRPYKTLDEAIRRVNGALARIKCKRTGRELCTIQ